MKARVLVAITLVISSCALVPDRPAETATPEIPHPSVDIPRRADRREIDGDATKPTRDNSPPTNTPIASTQYEPPLGTTSSTVERDASPLPPSEHNRPTLTVIPAEGYESVLGEIVEVPTPAPTPVSPPLEYCEKLAIVTLRGIEFNNAASQPTTVSRDRIIELLESAYTAMKSFAVVARDPDLDREIRSFSGWRVLTADLLQAREVVEVLKPMMMRIYVAFSPLRFGVKC